MPSGLNVGRSFAFFLSAAATLAAAAGETKVGWLEIQGSPANRPSELEWLLGSGDSPTLRQLVEEVDGVAKDSDLSGLVIRLKDASLTATQVQELGTAIKRVRESGKKVHVLGESFDTPDFLLGSYCDGALCQAGGAVSLPGLYIEEMFLADTLAWAGIKADFVQVGDYKGASEQLVNSKPSQQWDENINQLLDSMYGNIRSQLKSGRKLSDQQLDQAMEKLWMGDADEAVKAGLLDAEFDLPDVTNQLAKIYKVDDLNIETLQVGGKSGGPMDVSNPFAMMAMLTKEPDNRAKGPTIAVLHIDGAIIDGDSVSGFSGGGEVGSRTVRNALSDIAAEDNIKAMVIRIDSPGGSATASEIIWQGVQRVAQKKPVWVSVGGMAASGGYYIAVAGSKIYVNPSSIVGSIGVVGGKLSMEGLYEKFKVNVVGRGRGPRAAMFASADGWSEADRLEVRAKMTSTYGLFTKRVTAGRAGIDLAKTAEGRLFTGDKAIELKMADKIGGLDLAIADLAKEVNLTTYAVMDFPPPRALGAVIEDAMKSFILSPSIASPVPSTISGPIRAILGDKSYTQIESSIRALLDMRDGKLMLVSPRVIMWK